MTEQIIGNWKLSYMENKTAVAEGFSPKTGAEVSARLESVAATVPGNFELDFMREGKLPDLYYGTNVLLAQRLENLHLYYWTKFVYHNDCETEAQLVFEGIDTVAEIFLDGAKLGFAENMLHAHAFSLAGVADGEHDLLVHIFPTALYARQFDLPAMCRGLKYNSDSTEIRKAPYMFGWDIMPRIVSGGLWKPVKIEKRFHTHIENPFTYTERIGSDGSAYLNTVFKVVSDEDFITDFSVKIEILFKDEPCTQVVQRCYNANERVCIKLKNPKLWYPKNYGEPNLYTVVITLLKGNEEIEKQHYRIGIRTVKLLRTSCAGDNGEFCFQINEKKVFCLGTNWVPTDAFPSRQEHYDQRALALVKEAGCNMIRCWGGNLYPSQAVYDFCDENGIMIWQDFAFGCAHYPDDGRLCRLTKEEVKSTVMAYRNHPSLVLWAGDNECDMFAPRGIDPNENVLTRDVILHEVRNHDATRPYLPSSPYRDEIAYLNGSPSEDHCWGPRNYFKGEYYKNIVSHFASEIGYHGCNSPKSLRRFIPEESMAQMGTSADCDNADWLVHASGMETATKAEGNPYAYRIPLMISHVERIFTEKSDNLDDFARQSQISQAEANKYFIEKFRVEKWRKTGIIWWNIIDGWPQISDAVVDWYGCKKLAFHYIKRSQQPFMMMLDEPNDGKMKLYAVNDLQNTVEGSYRIQNLRTGKTVSQGAVTAENNSSAFVTEIKEEEYAFYLIQWETNAGTGVNHHACSLGNRWDFADYLENMKKAGFYAEFEGF